MLWNVLIDYYLHGGEVAGYAVGTYCLYAGDVEALASLQALERLALTGGKRGSVAYFGDGVAHKSEAKRS